MEVIHVKNLTMPASLESRFQKRDKDLKITVFHCNRDQEIILIGCSNGTIVMWSKKGNIASYKLYQNETILSIRENSEEKKHKGAIMCLSYEFIESRYGDQVDYKPYIFSSSVDATLKIWDLETKEEKFRPIQTLVGHSGTVVSFKYLPSTDYLFTVATDRTIKIWKQDEAKHLLHYPWFLQVTCINFSVDRIPLLKNLDPEKIQFAHFTRIGFKPDQLDMMTLFICDDIGNVHLFKVKEQDSPTAIAEFIYEKSNMELHRLSITDILITLQENTAYTTSFDQVICAFDLNTGKEFFKYANPYKTHFTNIRWDSANQELIASDKLGWIYFLQVKGDKGNYLQRIFKNPIVSFELIDKETPHLLVCTENSVEFFKINKGFKVQRLIGGHEGPVIGLNYLNFKCLYNETNKLPSKLLSIGLDNTLRVWDTTDNSLAVTLEAPDDTEVMCMCYLKQFGLVCTGHENGDIYMWDIEIGTKVKLGAKVNTKNTICCLVSGTIGGSPCLFASGYDGKIYLWEFTEKRSASYDSLIYPQLKLSFYANQTVEKENTRGQEIFTMAFNQSEEELYAAGNSEQIYVIKFDNKTPLEYKFTMTGHKDSINCL
jgi:WD40 repeat protein